MAEVYFTRARGSAFQEVTFHIRNAAPNSPTQRYWREVLWALERKINR
jgi:hypothetical protein